MHIEAIPNAPPQPDAARGDFVVRRGTFFQVGDYPDKQFALTEAEADAAIARFAPVPLNIEHIPTIFDGKLGMVRRLWREGKDLLAEYVIPRWLHEVTRGEAIKISSEWSRTTKCPQGGAFVLHPRVADAVMLAAFHNTTPQQTADRADASAAQGSVALSGRTTGARANGAAFALCAEREEHRQIEHTPTEYAPTEQAQGGPAKRNHDVRNDEKYTEEARTLPSPGKEMKTMSLLSGLRALFQRAGVPAGEIDAHLNGTGAQSEGEDTTLNANRQFSETDRKEADEEPLPASEGSAPDGERADVSQNIPSAQFARMEAELTRLREEARQAQDAQNEARFAGDAQAIETLVRGGRMTPAEADAWRQIARDKPAAFAVVLPALHARPRLPHLGGATVRAGQAHDADRLETLTRQRMREKELDHAQAFREICGENKDLALSVRTQSQEGS